MNEEAGFRIETDSLGEVRVPRDRLWGAQTQRSLAFFSIGNELMPRDMVAAFAIVKKASAAANCQLGALDESRGRLICQVCDEILAGLHAEMFPLHVWMTGSGTQFNMNVNEVISNRCCQLAGTPLGSKSPVHPNDHANRSHSSNDAFPTAMCIAAACKTSSSLLPSLLALRDAIAERAAGWDQIVKIGRTHLQDATPLTLGQEWSGFAALLTDAAERIRAALPGVLRIPLGGTAVGTGINAPEGFDRAAAAGIASATGQPFVPSPNKFAAQGSHDDLIHLHGALRVLAVALHKIACDIRLVSSGPRAGIRELIIPSNEPGSSIMPGKVNPTQAEALTMITFQVMANDVAVSLAGSGGHLQMNAYKPLLIHNLMGSLSLLADGCDHFRKFLIEGTRPDVERISSMVGSSLMLATALTPAVGYDRAAAAAHLASRENITLREAVLKLGLLAAGEYDRLTDPAGMVSNRKPPPHA